MHYSIETITNIKALFLHKSPLIFTISSLIALLLLSGCTQDKSQYDGNPQSKPAAFKRSLQSHKGLFNLTLYSEDQKPIPINQYHNWIIGLSDTDGKPVYPAAFAIAGGMPEHGHGLPTQPQVTRHLGDGEYLLEGIKFTMDGEWVFQFQILSGDLQDAAEITFNVEY
jgi:hypothetical protein